MKKLIVFILSLITIFVTTSCSRKKPDVEPPEETIKNIDITGELTSSFTDVSATITLNLDNPSDVDGSEVKIILREEENKDVKQEVIYSLEKNEYDFNNLIGSTKYEALITINKNNLINKVENLSFTTEETYVETELKGTLKAAEVLIEEFSIEVLINEEYITNEVIKIKALGGSTTHEQSYEIGKTIYKFENVEEDTDYLIKLELTGGVLRNKVNETHAITKKTPHVDASHLEGDIQFTEVKDTTAIININILDETVIENQVLTILLKGLEQDKEITYIKGHQQYTIDNLDAFSHYTVSLKVSDNTLINDIHQNSFDTLKTDLNGTIELVQKDANKIIATITLDDEAKALDDVIIVLTNEDNIKEINYTIGTSIYTFSDLLTETPYIVSIKTRERLKNNIEDKSITIEKIDLIGTINIVEGIHSIDVEVNIDNLEDIVDEVLKVELTDGVTIESKDYVLNQTNYTFDSLKENTIYSVSVTISGNRFVSKILNKSTITKKILINGTLSEVSTTYNSLTTTLVLDDDSLLGDANLSILLFKGDDFIEQKTYIKDNTYTFNLLEDDAEYRIALVIENNNSIESNVGEITIKTAKKTVLEGTIEEISKDYDNIVVKLTLDDESLVANHGVTIVITNTVTLEESKYPYMSGMNTTKRNLDEGVEYVFSIEIDSDEFDNKVAPITVQTLKDIYVLTGSLDNISPTNEMVTFTLNLDYSKVRDELIYTILVDESGEEVESQYRPENGFYFFTGLTSNKTYTIKIFINDTTYLTNDVEEVTFTTT